MGAEKNGSETVLIDNKISGETLVRIFGNGVSSAHFRGKDWVISERRKIVIPKEELQDIKLTNGSEAMRLSFRKMPHRGPGKMFLVLGKAAPVHEDVIVK